MIPSRSSLDSAGIIAKLFQRAFRQELKKRFQAIADKAVDEAVDEAVKSSKLAIEQFINPRDNLYHVEIKRADKQQS